jgi:hypothetical protein
MKLKFSIIYIIKKFIKLIFPNFWVVFCILKPEPPIMELGLKNGFNFEIKFHNFQVFELFCILGLKPKVMQLIPRIDPVSKLGSGTD